MYRSIEDFKRNWTHEAAQTMRYFDVLTDSSLAYHSPGFRRSLGRMAQHIGEAPSRMMRWTGEKVEWPYEPGTEATSTKDLAENYKKTAQSLTDIVSKWKDADLNEVIPFNGREMSKGMLLNVIILHQTHHRGQLSVLMREAGVEPPGIYGPTHEEWVSMGQEPLK